jgi:ATP-binding cassette subfamily B protein
LVNLPQGQYAQLWRRQSGLFVAGSEARITPQGLAAIPLFAASSPATLGALAPSFISEAVAPGTRIIRQGQPGTRFFVIARGRVEVSLDRPGGAVTVASLSDGDFFGEMALLDATTTSAHVTATEPTVVLALEKTTFLVLLSQDPGLAEAVSAVARRRREANAQVGRSP